MTSAGTGLQVEGRVPFWRLSAVEYRVAAVAIPLSLIARWHALLPGYSIDDLAFINSSSMPAGPAIARGRWLAWLIRESLGQLGAAPPRAAVIASVLLAVVLVGVGLVCCRLWRIHDRFAESLTATCLIALHPYQAEIFTFRTAALFLAIPLALSFGALAAYHKSRRHWLVSALAVICALATYQVVLNYMALAIFFSLIFFLARPKESTTPEHGRGAASAAALLVVGVCAYVLTTGIAARFTSEPLSQRAMLLGFHEIGGRVRTAVDLARTIFLRQEPIMPLGTKWLVIASAITAGAGAIFSHWRERTRAGLLAIVFVLAAVGGVIGSMGTVLALREWWPVPRVLSQTGIFCAGFIALGLRYAPAGLRRPVLAAAALTVFSFVGINNGVFSDQLRLNMRDISKANRMIGVLEARPDFAGIRGLYISGGHWAYPSPIATAQGDMNISLLYASWSKVLLINEVSGYMFAEAPAEVSKRAEEYCRHAPKWPAAESVTRLDAYAVVCQAKE